MATLVRDHPALGAARPARICRAGGAATRDRRRSFRLGAAAGRRSSRHRIAACRDSGGGLPGLPWRASFGRISGLAPGLGADTEAVLRDVLGISPEKIAALRQSGALG